MPISSWPRLNEDEWKERMAVDRMIEAGVMFDDEERCPSCGAEVETHLQADGLITRCFACGYVVD